MTLLTKGHGEHMADKKDKNLIDKLEAGIQEKKLQTDKDEASDETIDKIEEAEDKLENVVERKVDDMEDTVKGLVQEMRANPQLLDSFREGPAAYIRSHINEDLSAAVVEGLVEELRGEIGGKIVPPAPTNNGGTVF